MEGDPKTALKLRIAKLRKQKGAPPFSKLHNHLGAVRVAIELVAGIAVGTGMGLWLGHRVGLTPLGLVCGATIGLIAGLYNIYRYFR